MLVPGQLTRTHPRLVVTDVFAGTNTTRFATLTGVTLSAQLTSVLDNTLPPVILTFRSTWPVLWSVNATATGELLDPAGRVTGQAPLPLVLRLKDELNVMSHERPMGLTIAVAVATDRVAKVTVAASTPWETTWFTLVPSGWTIGPGKLVSTGRVAGRRAR